MSILYSANMNIQCYLWYLHKKQHHLLRLWRSQFLCLEQNQTLIFEKVVDIIISRLFFVLKVSQPVVFSIRKRRLFAKNLLQLTQ